MEYPLLGRIVPLFLVLICSSTFEHTAAIQTHTPPTTNSDNHAILDEISEQRSNRVMRLMLPDEGLTVKHLPKAGGTFLKQVLSASVRGLHVENEGTPLSSADVANQFVIGLVRNPFDYYVSLWSYNSFTSGGGMRKALTVKEQAECFGKSRGEEESFGDSPDDKMRFRRFVQVVSQKDMGLLSTRFFFSYLGCIAPHAMQPSIKRTSFVFNTSQQILSSNTMFLKAMQDGFRKFHASAGPVSCWVHTETLVDDAEACLKQYERLAGKRGSVNWEAFTNTVNGAYHNPTKHAACSTLYDYETRKYILQSDRHIFEAFNYSHECPTLM